MAVLRQSWIWGLGLASVWGFSVLADVRPARAAHSSAELDGPSLGPPAVTMPPIDAAPPPATLPPTTLPPAVSPPRPSFAPPVGNRPPAAAAPRVLTPPPKSPPRSSGFAPRSLGVAPPVVSVPPMPGQSAATSPDNSATDKSERKIMPRLQRKLAGSNEPAATGNNKLFPNLRKRPAAPLTEAEPYNGSLGEAPRTPLPLDTKPAPRRLLNPKKYGSVELFPAPKAEERPAGPPSVRRSVLAW